MIFSRIVFAILIVLVFANVPLPLLGAVGIEELKKGVVKITAQVEDRNKVGTGFIVRVEQDSVYVVTAAHVVAGASTIEAEFFTDRNHFHVTRVLGLEGDDEAGGVAVLKIEKAFPRDAMALQTDQTLSVRAGDQVTMIGFPRNAGVPWAITKGELVGRKEKTLIFTGAVDEGSSGGPLIKDNRIIGVVTASKDKFGYAAPAMIAQYVLEGWGVKFGVQLRSQPAKISPSEIVRVIQEKGFNHPFDSSLREEGFSGSVRGAFHHEFALIGTKAVVDHATGLMWRREAVKVRSGGEKATDFIQQFDKQKTIGFSDWRVPTVEELASLVEPLAFGNGPNRNYISDLFDLNCGDDLFLTADEIVWSWKRHDHGNEGRYNVLLGVVAVNFNRGEIDGAYITPNTAYCLLLVRTMKSDELAKSSLLPLPRSE
jgi:Protein of unknown function (DUF1566)/Trypsin-like peptidase domain